jgi:hypothetical protein
MSVLGPIEELEVGASYLLVTHERYGDEYTMVESEDNYFFGDRRLEC